MYENHAHNSVKSLAVKYIAFIRLFTVRMPSRLVYGLSCFFPPFVYLLFYVPARFAATRHLVDTMPFNFGNGFFLFEVICTTVLTRPLKSASAKKMF